MCFLLLTNLKSTVSSCSFTFIRSHHVFFGDCFCAFLFAILNKSSGGITTLSASGILVDRQLGLVLTTATLLSPFLQLPPPSQDQNTPPSQWLKKGAEIHILTEYEYYPSFYSLSTNNNNSLFSQKK
jgi:hypothetical protein